jgi:hypothetical protein
VLVVPYKKSRIKIIDKSIQEENINIVYPQLKFKHKRLQHKINKIILQTVQVFIKEESEKLEDQMSLDGEYKVTLNKRNFLSLTFEIYLYSKIKNMHFNILKSLTINTVNAHIYNFKDFFREESDYGAVLNKIILQQIKDNDIPIIEEFANINKNRSFYLTDNSLVIYYELYRHSTYASAYWAPEFIIPFDSIKAFINPKGPIAMLLK